MQTKDNRRDCVGFVRGPTPETLTRLMQERRISFALEFIL